MHLFKDDIWASVGFRGWGFSGLSYESMDTGNISCLPCQDKFVQVS